MKHCTKLTLSQRHPTLVKVQLKWSPMEKQNGNDRLFDIKFCKTHYLKIGMCEPGTGLHLETMKK